MSSNVNTEWLEAAHENFQQAVSDRNFSLVQAIIGDTREQGFEEAAQAMEETIEEIPAFQYQEKE